MYQVTLTGKFQRLTGKLVDIMQQANVSRTANEFQLCEAARLVCGEGSVGWEEGVEIDRALIILERYGFAITPAYTKPAITERDFEHLISLECAQNQNM